MESSELNESTKKHPLSREEAEVRKLLLTDSEDGGYELHYNLLLTLRRAKDKSKCREGKRSLRRESRSYF